MRGAAGLLNLERQYNRVQLCNTSLPLTGCGTHHVAQSKGRLQLPHPAPPGATAANSPGRKPWVQAIAKREPCKGDAAHPLFLCRPVSSSLGGVQSQALCGLGCKLRPPLQGWQ